MTGVPCSIAPTYKTNTLAFGLMMPRHCVCLVILLGLGLNYKMVSCQTQTPYGPEEQMCPSEGDVMMTNFVPWGVPWRAYLTLPTGLSVMPSKIPKAGLGVVSTMFIKKYTWLGECEGEIVDRKSNISPYAWLIRRNGVLTAYVDGYHVDRSSYHRFMNCPRRHIDENVQHMACYGKILYITKKDIVPGDELQLYYGHRYARNRLKINLNEYYDVARFWRKRGFDLNKYSHRAKVRATGLELHDVCRSCPRHRVLMALDLQ